MNAAEGKRNPYLPSKTAVGFGCWFRLGSWGAEVPIVRGSATGRIFCTNVAVDARGLRRKDFLSTIRGSSRLCESVWA